MGHWKYWFVLLLVACGEAGVPRVGDDTFESASWAGSYRSDGAPTDDEGGGGERVVEEADIYRFSGHRLYVLNMYRGLYVFDVRDPALPVELGRMPLSGNPVEMYVRGTRAYAIVSDYFSYWRDGLTDAALSPVQGSRIVGIDLTDPESPVEIGEVVLDGWISDTRMVGDILYVAANRSASFRDPAAPADEVRDELVVTSIDVSDPARMRRVEQQVVPGSGWFVHASPEAFLVAGTFYDDRTGSGATELRWVDITSPTGEMRFRGRVVVDGSIQDDSAIDLWENQLRLLTRSWDGSTTHLSVFDATRPDELPLLGRLDYFYEGGLFATTFDGPRAYMVHYMRIDPLEVVDLSDPTAPRVVGILEIPGWVERIAALGDRLVGLGIDDTDGRRVSLSLFDVSDASTPVLLDRISTGDDWSWSAATWERKAWTVDAEEGLILFPFSGWSEDGRTYRNALGIVELTRDALVARGEVEAPAAVERGSIYQDHVFAISQAAVQVVDVRDREHPRPTATLELARTVVGYARTPRAGVELVRPWLEWGWGSSTASPPSLRVTPLDAPDGRTEMARLALPRSADSVLAHGDLVVTVAASSYCGGPGVPRPEGDGGASYCGPSDRPGVVIVSLAEPTAPRVVASYDLPEPEPLAVEGEVDGGWVWSWSSWRTGLGAPFGGYAAGSPALAVGDGRFVLLRTRTVTCEGAAACRRVGIEPIRVGDGSYAYERGSRIDNALVVLDLSDAASPILGAALPLDEGAIEHPFVADGVLVYSRAEPWRIDEHGRSWVRYYLQRWEVRSPGRMRMYPAINVPGVAIALRDGGDTVVTLDRLWSEGPSEIGDGATTWLNVLDLAGDRAVRVGVLGIVGDAVSATMRAERVYVVHSRYLPLVRDGFE
ncbi:MAG: beta-propeller domain-containing protein, partial [Deltaproteobacteria bacterium]|nr:beta-propeller domain-containing protein [Deltaproteobacteria bacterium]